MMEIVEPRPHQVSSLRKEARTLVELAKTLPRDQMSAHERAMVRTAHGILAKDNRRKTADRKRKAAQVSKRKNRKR